MTKRRIKAASTYPGAGSMVYVVHCDGLYKIGVSSNVSERVRSLQTASPHLVTLIGTIEGDRSIEALWHYQFREKHVRGEWFRLTPEDVRYVLASDDDQTDPFAIGD